MWSSLIIGLLSAGVVALLAVVRKQRKLIEELKREREELQAQENRVFDFLHGLGEAFSGDLRSSDLYRLIVEGATRIIDAHGGALYLVDRTGKLLVPSFISKSCPPLVDIPQSISQQSLNSPVALESYVRLHTVKSGEGLLGAVWERREPLFLSSKDSDPRLEGLRHSALELDSIMIGPLIYANQNLGVLAVANGPMSAPFSASDFVVFQSIVEQSAFALYNAVVYSEAGDKRRIDRDLEVAHDIQRILLPNAAPAIEGFEIAGLNIPASQVSGDYYDYIPLGGDRIGIAIADVSGKGVAASLIMAMCRSVLRSVARSSQSAATVLHEVNRQVYPDIREDMFISMAYLIAQKGSDELVLARAGHDAPLHFRASDQSVTRINPPGMALGIDSGSVFNRVTSDFRVRLEAGDCLILYTDGVTEALDVDGLEFGISKLIEAVQASSPNGAPAILSRVTSDLKSFVGGHHQNDDITLIAIRKL
ncbi:MAG TPA: GAF domain-containing SpoIIE family protein phosphatase [Chthoniobacterales bacterium]|jgi:sigma-B regulation protein RsbU (phosphoserine phosphatase)|nr:GAF domain-containing SpoIIE family protein phosphatase [Chthoniobacterales bacterium]